MLQRWVVLGQLLGLMWLCACGGTPEPEASVEPSAHEGGEAPQEERSMAVTGLMGTIPERKIHRTLERRLGRFQRCFFDGSETVEFLSGAVRFYFRVDRTGTVESVYLRDSSVGHRGTERCLLDRASEARFPEPQGGDAAEFAWGFELDPPDGVRPPVAWTPDSVASVRAPGAAVLSECAVGSATITAYVAPGGEVLSVGIADQEVWDPAALDCVVNGLAGLDWPDPGSYAAKVTFPLP